MSKTRIFVSSTCYDLAPVREEIRNFISDLGHEPLLSEFPSFPVSPDINTIENCQKVIKESSDIFILIVGGRRGSLDPETSKPITNIEFESAKENEIDSFIFIYKPVLNLLSVWEKNPDADFSPQVDYPEVFKFIKKMQNEQKWIFPFDRVGEIKEILRIQFSFFFKSLLDKKREGMLVPIKELLNESRRAQKLALEKPDYWEYLFDRRTTKNKINDN